jgi:metal-responsive CopG/Arc/MetJ family transcriptional regulator
MPKMKVAVTLRAELVERVDELVVQQRFRNRSQAIEAALAEKLQRLGRNRLAVECSRLDRKEEKALAEEGLTGSLETWPEY